MSILFTVKISSEYMQHYLHIFVQMQPKRLQQFSDCKNDNSQSSFEVSDFSFAISCLPQFCPNFATLLPRDNPRSSIYLNYQVENFWNFKILVEGRSGNGGRWVSLKILKNKRNGVSVVSWFWIQGKPDYLRPANMFAALFTGSSSSSFLLLVAMDATAM